MPGRVAYEAEDGTLNTVWHITRVLVGDRLVYVDDRHGRLIPIDRIVDIKLGPDTTVDVFTGALPPGMGD